MSERSRELVFSSFEHFYIQFFQARNPGAELLFPPVVPYICHQYQDLAPGDRLVINMPPRSGKSLLAEAYALWSIGRNPTEKILFISNHIKLAEDHIYEARKVMRSDWYKSVFKETRISADRSSLQHLQTTSGGRLIAGSTQTSLGGIGATKIIIDDGNRIDDADDPEGLERVNDKFDGEILSRLNPIGKKKRRGIVINVQHRLAENDLSGHLIASGFKCIAFPLEATRTKTYHWADKTWTRKKGHILFENYSEEELKKLRQLRSPPFPYFYQQAQGRGNALQIKSTDFKLCDRKNSAGPFVISVDAAQGDSGSYNVAQVWNVSEKPLHLRTQFRERCGFNTFQLEVTRLIRRWRPGAILVENAANGPALVSFLSQRLPSANFVLIDPQGSKAERLTRHAKAISAGAISLEQKEPWVDDYMSEFLQHPKLGSDQVDATTQLMDWRPEDRNIVAAESFHTGPSGVLGSTMQKIRPRSYAVSSKTPGIVRVQRRR